MVQNTRKNVLEEESWWERLLNEYDTCWTEIGLPNSQSSCFHKEPELEKRACNDVIADVLVSRSHHEAWLNQGETQKNSSWSRETRRNPPLPPHQPDFHLHAKRNTKDMSATVAKTHKDGTYFTQRCALTAWRLNQGCLSIHFHKLWWQLIWIQIHKRQENPKQRCRIYILYVQDILDYQLLEQDQIQEGEKTLIRCRRNLCTNCAWFARSCPFLPTTMSRLCRRLWKNYRVKFPERAECLQNSSEISAFRARTEFIKTRVCRSKHNQPLKPNSQESEISPTCRRCGQSNEIMTQIFEDCPRFKSLRARSRAMQQLFEKVQIDARTWEEILTRKADPALAAVLDKVIYDCVRRLLNDWDKLKSKKCSLIRKFPWKRKRVVFELAMLGLKICQICPVWKRSVQKPT